MQNKLIKSPLNYTGGKYKLLPQLLPLFPQDINTFIDLFTGGCNVAVNVNAKKIIANDLYNQVIEVYDGIKKMGTKESIKSIEETSKKFNLSKTNKEGYYNIRNYYNSGNKEWYVFYTLVAHAFSNQIRFNKKGEYNMPFGERYFNPKLKQNFINFANAIQDKNIIFTNKDFREFNVDNLNKNDFVYLDPPYLITCASYNEQNGWNENLEKELLKLCDKLNERNIKFALSNVLEHKGNKNEILINWSKKYKIHNLNYNYNNSNYHSTAKNNKTIEVLITNY